MVNDNPYKERQLCSRVFVREFSLDDSDEFVWHRDREDRVVWSESNTDWEVQLDDALPRAFDRPVWIPAGVYHRVIPGADTVAVFTVVKL